MQIFLSPQLREDRLSLERDGDALIINGERFDFSPLKDGETLPRHAVNCAWLVSDVKRTKGQIVLSLILPHGYAAPEESRFPKPILNPKNGQIEIPPYNSEE